MNVKMNELRKAMRQVDSPPRDQRLAVAYASDRNYHDMTLISLASLALAHHAPVDFFLFQDGYASDVPAHYRSAIEAPGHRLTIAQSPGYAPASLLTVANHLTLTTFSRVAIIELLARDYDYILYLDGDTLAFGDLRCDDLAGFPEIAAACPDLSISTGFDDPEFHRNCSRNGVSPDYFNAGVLMINGNLWLKTRALDRFTHNLDRHSKGCVYHCHCSANDQCVLNMTFDGKQKILPVTYNVQKSAFHTQAWSTALIRHYTGRKKFMPVRPWRCDRREYELLQHVCRLTGLPFPRGYFDYGLSYHLNAVRRYRTTRRYDRAIEKLQERIDPMYGPGGQPSFEKVGA